MLALWDGGGATLLWMATSRMLLQAETLDIGA